MERIKKVIVILLFFSTWLLNYHFVTKEEVKYPQFKGFGWYGYLADDELNEESIQKIKELGGNAVNINVYYEYSLENESFILLSNLTKIKKKIELAHRNGLIVFLSPFVNLVGGHYMAGSIIKPEKFLEDAKNISVELAKFAEENEVEIYAVWNELGLALLKIPNSTDLTNKWLQDVRVEIRKFYKGILTTKEGVQLGLYENYNFSGFDCIGVTFYPFTTSFARDPYTNITYAGVESLEEYESVVNQEFDKLEKLKKKFGIDCVILGEIGIDVIGGKFVGNDEEGKKLRAKAYEIILAKGAGRIDGFFFSKFEYKNGGSEELDKILKKYFKSSGSKKKIYLNGCSTIDKSGTYFLSHDIIDSISLTCFDIWANNVILNCNNHLIDGKKILPVVPLYIFDHRM